MKIVIDIYKKREENENITDENCFKIYKVTVTLFLRSTTVNCIDLT